MAKIHSPKRLKPVGADKDSLPQEVAALLGIAANGMPRDKREKEKARAAIGMNAALEGRTIRNSRIANGGKHSARTKRP